jgi:hypothetical protein
LGYIPSFLRFSPRPGLRSITPPLSFYFLHLRERLQEEIKADLVRVYRGVACLSGYVEQKKFVEGFHGNPLKYKAGES